MQQLNSLVDLELRSPDTFLVEEAKFPDAHKQIKDYVKALRKKSSRQINEGHTQGLSKAGNAIMDFMSQPDAAASPLYIDALITLNNALNIQNDFLHQFRLEKAFYSNIRAYFRTICVNWSKSEDSARFEIYSAMYLIVMLIYRNTAPQDKELMIAELFQKTVISQFLNLEVPTNSRAEKLVGIILLFITKNVNITTWGRRIKNFLFTNIHLTQDSQHHSYFISVLRQVKSLIELVDATKINLVSLLNGWLSESQERNYLPFLFEITLFLFKKYSVLGFKAIEINILQTLEKFNGSNEQYVLAIFEAISPCLTSDANLTILEAHLKQIFINSTLSNNMTSIRMMSILMSVMPSTTFMQLYKQNVFDRLLQFHENTLVPSEKKVYLGAMEAMIVYAGPLCPSIATYFYGMAEEVLGSEIGEGKLKSKVQEIVAKDRNAMVGFM